MNTQEEEASAEFAHTIEELLKPLADKDPEIIKAFLTTAADHPGTRLSLWALATLHSCDPEEYPKVNDIPEIRALRKEGLSEEGKRYLLDQKAINEIRDITSYGSGIEFKMRDSSPDEASGVRDTNLSVVNKEIVALTKFRQALRLRRGTGPSIGEAPGKPSA